MSNRRILYLMLGVILLGLFHMANDDTKITKQVTEKQEKTVKKYKLTNNEKKMLACLVYCEAGSEPYKGKKAVVNVVMNRVKSKNFPNTVTKVIKQKGQFGPYSSGKLSKEMRNYEKGMYNKKSDKCRYDSLRSVTAAINAKSVVGSRCYFNAAKYAGYHKNSITIGSQKFW